MSYPPNANQRDDLNDPTRQLDPDATRRTQLPNTGGTVYSSGSVSQPAGYSQGAHSAQDVPPQQQQPSPPAGPVPPQIIPPVPPAPPQPQPPRGLPGAALSAGAIVGVAAVAVGLLVIGIPAGLLTWRAAGHLPAADGNGVIGGALLLAGTATLAGGLIAQLLRRGPAEEPVLQRLVSPPLVFVVAGVLLMLFAAIAA
ncbi:hypothetical protein [Fodinicola acaciae]|uniref:hypothetical protein n=1 Tax=Fodinicola acaciae TaxID=2681555 RepID=UPI0013D2C240|nr:hypothetical protein [Fodinicola acaciae]